MVRLNAQNLAQTTLASDLPQQSTTITVSSSIGFPPPPFRVMIYDPVNYEIVEVSAVNGNTWTVIRAQENTSARAWNAGAFVELRWTAGMYNEMKDAINNKADRVSSQTIAFTEQTLTVSQNGTYNINWQNGNKARLTFSAASAITLTFTNPPGACNLILLVRNAPSGSSSITWPSSVKWAGGIAPTLTNSPNAIDIVTFYFDGTNYYGMMANNFA